MNWILLAILAYFILAITNLTDKFFLDKALPSAKAYTLLVNLGGGLAVLAAPWFLIWPGWQLLSVNLLVGALFPFGLLLLYTALKNGEPSKVLVLVGSCVPIFTLLLSVGFLNERFSLRQWIALLGLVLGAALIAWLPAKNTWLTRISHWLKLNNEQENMGIIEAVLAALIFSIVMVGSKSLYSTQTFMSAFIWIRLGSALAVLLVLFHTPSRHEIKNSFKHFKGKTAVAFSANQLLSATAFSLQNYALFLGSAAIVNALQGVQYALLLVFGALLSIFKPKLIKEKITPMIIIQKIMAIMVISLSLYLLVV